eukprot:gene19973-21931_t
MDGIEIDLREIIKKLGHQLSEIRFRALENILSKLRNQLICIEDLVHHRELIINLLQWFNFENISKVEEVLQLLDDLSRHSSAASVIYALGGFEFLSTLRQDLSEKASLEKIDNILNNLFWVHTEQEVIPRNVPENVPERSPENASDASLKHVSGQKNLTACSASSGRGLAGIMQQERPALFGKNTGSQPSALQNRASNTTEITQTIQSSDTEIQEKEYSVPVTKWIVLTSSDRHILSVTESRLQSHSPSLVIQSCEFFRDVLLQDFPTHIFIQRPNILKTLLHLLEIYTGKDESITNITFSCLSEVTLKLYHSSLHQRNDNFIELLNNLRSNATSQFDEYEGEILTEALQQSQWTGLDFCLNIVSSTCSYLTNFVRQTNKCEDVIILMNRALKVLSLYDIPAMWDKSLLNRKIYDIMTCLRRLGDVVESVLEVEDGFVMQQLDHMEDVKSNHALLADVTMVSVRFINATVPLSRVYEAVPEGLLRCFKSIFCNEMLVQCYPFTRMALNDLLKTAEDEFYEQYKQALEVIASMKATKEFLQKMQSQEKRSDLSSLLDLCERSLPSVGFHCYANFIKGAVVLLINLNKSMDVDPLLENRGMNILLCLLAHGNEQVQENTYQTCLDVITMSEKWPQPDSDASINTIALSNASLVRNTMALSKYSLDCREALTVSHVTEPLSSLYQKATFIVNSKILKEIVCFGLDNTNKKIMNYSVNILVSLLLGRLNMSPKLWQTLLDCCLPVLPILQGFASEDKALQRAMISLSDASNALLTSSGELYSLPPVEQLRASIRFMFVRDANLRAQGFASLVWTMTQEDSRNGNAARYPFESIQDACSILIVDPTIAARFNSRTSAVHSNFVASQIDQLWDILISSAIDNSLKQSAAEQLSILLQDQSWHNQLLEKGAKDLLIEVLHSNISNIKSFSVASVDVDSKLILCCVTMLKNFALHNSAVRNTLVFEKSLYLDIIKARLLFSENEAFHYESSCLLMLLAFDEFIRKDEKEAISMPNLVYKRYSLPFKPELHQISTEFRDKHNEHKGYSITDATALSAEPLFSMIRINWNIILAGGADNIEHWQAYDSQKESQLYSSKLAMTEKEVQILREALPAVAMKKCLATLTQAKSHAAAMNCLRELKKYLLVSICRDSTKEDVFSRDFDQLASAMKEENCLNRIMMSSREKSRLAAIKCVVNYSNLMVQTSSQSSLDFAVDFLRSLMQDSSPINKQISTYSLQSTNKVDFPANQEDPYDSTNEKRLLYKEALNLIISISLKANSSVTSTSDCTTDIKGIGIFISVLMQSLVRVDSSSYYDLPVLETTLDCLYNVTYRRGWSMLFNGSGENLCNSMAKALIQILHSFHADRIGAATSFMGKGVMLKAALCLCHVAKESQTYSGQKDWTSSWIHSKDVETSDANVGIPWLVPLLTDRVLGIRWAGWSLTTALSSGCIGSEYVINEFQVYPGGVWASAIGVFLDNCESPIVRSQASTLLSTLLLKLLNKEANVAGDNDLWSNMVVQDTNTKSNISGFPAFLLLLDHFQFFKKIKEILLQKAVPPQGSHSATTMLHNVSTSCSTPSSDIMQKYEQISDYSDEQPRTDRASILSDHRSDERSSSNRRNMQNSSVESLLLGVSDTPSESEENGDRMYRLKFDQSAEASRFTPKQPQSNRLASSLFKLLSHLVKIDATSVTSSLEGHGLIAIITRFMDPELIKQMILEASDNRMCERRVVTFKENARMISNLFALINFVASSNPTVMQRLQSDKYFTERVLSIFELPSSLLSGDKIPSVPKTIQSSLFDVWQEALRLLHKLICKTKGLDQSAVELSLKEHLHLLICACPRTLQEGKSLSPTSRLFLVLLKNIMCREVKRDKQSGGLAITLDTPNDQLVLRQKDNTFGTNNRGICKEQLGGKLSIGAYFCDILMELCDRFYTAKSDKREVVSTLSVLFAVSISAKSFAVEHGFLESVLEEIKDTHVKLNLASIQLDKDNRDKRKEKPLLLELAELFHMLRNLVYCSQDTKKVAVESGLVASVQKMWSWSMVDKTLKIAVLEFLVTLTANCKKAQHVMCSQASTKGATGEITLLPSILKLLTKAHRDAMSPNGKIDSSLRLSFQLITNVAVLPECRAFLWKNNIYQVFSSSQVGLNASRKQKTASKVLTALWIHFLLVVSFFSDGTNVILKVKGLLATLIDFASDDQHRERQRCLLILRNLLFFPTNKPTLLTNNFYLAFLNPRSSYWLPLKSTGFEINMAKVTLKRTKLLGKMQLMEEELLTGKALSTANNTQGYEELKIVVRKTLKLLSE